MTLLAAEFRGPGIKNQFEDSGDDYDMDMHNGRGRIIFLGDGKEVLADGEEEDEDRDIDMNSNEIEPATVAENRREREETPGPEPHDTVELPKSGNMDVEKPESASKQNEDKGTSSPAATLPPNAIPETALPDKLVSPADTQQK